jgi:glycosyltransferase involved in cell wall biosynthesis
LDRPFISVCLLAHNSASYITTALESVIAQSFQDWELLISDDASTDGTENLVAPRLKDSRIRYVLHRENIKQANNWTYAIENTSAPVITTLHADDAWEPDALQTFANAFQQQTDLDLAWANWDYYDPGLKIRERSAPVTISKEMNGNDACSYLLDNNHALPSAAAFTREVAQRAGSPDPRFGMLCDRRYFLQLALAARRCRAIPKVLVRYRQNEGGVTSTFTSSGRLQEEMILFANDAENLFRRHPHGSALAKRLQVGLGKDLFLHGLGALLAGDRPRGTRWMKKGAGLAHWGLLEPSSLRGVARTIKRRIVGAL